MKTSENTVLVTGGASGIGLSLARAFLNCKNTVIICGRSQEKLKRVNDEYPGIHTIRCDVTDPVEVEQMLTRLSSEFPTVNILINNAGIQHIFDLLGDERAIQKIDEEIDINFQAVVRLTRIFLPYLAKAPEAAVINISSVLGVVPKKTAPVYCATKGAIHAFSKSLRYQLEGSSVKVFEVVAPIVDTQMTTGRESGIRKMSPDDLARAVLVSLERDKYEILPGASRSLLLANRMFPSLVERAAKQQ